MLRHLFNIARNVSARFAHLHLRYEGGGFQLGPPEAPLGRVEKIAWRANSVLIEGWTTGSWVMLNCQDAATVVAPEMPRPDMAEAFTNGQPKGFALRHPGRGPDPMLAVDYGDDARLELPVPPAPLMARTVAHLRLWGQLAIVILRALPVTVRYALSRDDRLRVEVKRALQLDAVGEGHRLVPDLFRAPTPVEPSPEPITIILPVYNAFDLLPGVLDRALTHTDLPFRLVVIEDASPDPQVRPFLRDAALRDARIELLENDRNLGFIGSVNRGLARAVQAGGHVVLLNSDAFVPAGWASRLLAPIHADASVATVTPMSNDAEIFTAPVICQRHDLSPGQADAIDDVARGLGGGERAVVPTGVGFCMAMNGDFVAKVPQLDPAFGRGYGEEVDWCQRARALGGRHVAQPRLFVEHRGGASFGSAEKLKLIQQNHQIIQARYPCYDSEVQGVLQEDPLISARLALGLAWLGVAARDAVPVYLAHSMGGGAEHWLQRQVTRDLAKGPGAVVIRVGGEMRWQIELVTADGRTTGVCEDASLIGHLLAPIARRRLIYSCGVGDRDPSSLPGMLCDLARDEDRVELLLHDYFPISPSYTLLDDDGEFRGAVTRVRDDAAHCFARADGREVPLADWQENWGRLVARADEVRAFCQSSADLFRATYPGSDPVVCPHHVPIPFAPWEAPAEGPVTIAVLGNLNLHKGAGVVRDLYAPAKAQGVRLVVLGRVDPALRMPAGLTVHGAYEPAQLPRLAEHYGVTHWLIPSIWPETFSFTTHEALATGLPVLGFDLGGQGEALRTAPNGVVINFKPSGDQIAAILAALAPHPPVH